MNVLSTNTLLGHSTTVRSSHYYFSRLCSFFIGAPTFPPQFLGYCQAVKKVFYFVHSTLYSIPPSESEYTIFEVDDDLDTKRHLIKFPKGGHLYYNDRNMELLLSRMDWIQVDVSIFGEANWAKRYQEHFLMNDGETGSSSASHPK